LFELTEGEKMSLWDDLMWEVSKVMEPIGEAVFGGLSATVDAVERAGHVAIDAVASAVDTVAENPGKATLIVVGTVATGGVALAAAGPIAAAAGSAGLLGAASTGTAISTLSGAALTSASLASIGGGAIAAGGAGIVGGTTVVAVGGAVTGAAVSGGVVAATKSEGGA
jgi:hypothetical protein